MGLEDVGIRLIAENAAQFQRAVDDTQKSIDHLDASVKKASKAQKESAAASDQMHNSLKKMGEAVVGAFAVGRIVEFGRQSITAASDMNETISKSQVVFGDLSKEIEKMGDQAATSMGLSKQEAIAAAATYGNLFTAMGMGERVAADMSMGLVQLASDLASFNNIPVGEALEKLRAGLVGEAEPLKSLGINLNEATLKQKAMELGLSDGKKVLDASTKAQAAYAIMLEQSGKAQGDFARTSTGLANQQRILEANFKNLQASIGKALLPAFLDLVRIGNQVMETLDQLAEKSSRYINILKEHDGVMQKTSKTYEEYRTEMVRAAEAAGWNVDAEGRLFVLRKDGPKWIKEYSDAMVIKNQTEYDGLRLLEQYGQAENDVGTNTRALTVDVELSEAALKLQKKAMEDIENAAKNIVTGSFTRLTQEMLNQKLIAGMSSDVALEYARSIGILDEQSYATLSSLQALTNNFDLNRDGLIDATEATKDYWEALNLLKDRNITITTTFIQQGQANLHPGTPGYVPQTTTPTNPTNPTKPKPPIANAKGGDYMVTKPTWFLAGEAGPERALFIPQAGGPSTMNYTSNYNLSVMTSQSPQVVQRSFAMMKLLAG